MLTLRVVYGLLYEFTIASHTHTWNPVFGSTIAFAFMCLLAEYVALLIFMYLGIHYMRNTVLLKPGSMDTA